MISTSTRTQTETFSRIFGIKNQFKVAFERLMEYSGEQCQPYLDAIQNKVVNQITFWAYTYDENSEREKWCELVLYVDWDKHEHFLIESKNEIFLRKAWNGTVPEVDVAIAMIEDAIKEFDLNPTFSVGFKNNISKEDYEFYMKKLGLVESKKVNWKAGSKSVYKKSPKELSELHAEIRVANERM